MSDHRKILAYQKSFILAMDIHRISKEFPPEEKYSLTDQLRRSSRSVCVNIVEAFKRSRYKNYFLTRLNDAETENAETQVWLDFALACKYISEEVYNGLASRNNEVGKLVWYMINNCHKFI
jgi:four helix bundle protein